MAYEFSVKKDSNWVKMEWTDVDENDTIDSAFLNDNVSDIWIEAEGTWGSTTLTLNGWVFTSSVVFPIVDPDGTAISFTANDNSPIRDAAPHFLPVLTGGTSVALDIRIWAKIAQTV